MTQTSPSGPGTKLQLNLTGEGANPDSMPCTTSGAASTTSPVVPDTGFFTSDTSTVSPFIISGAVFVIVAALATLFLLVLRTKRQFTFAKNFAFSVKNPRLALKRTGIFTGLFALALLSIGLIAPQFIDTDYASALDITESLTIATGSSHSDNVLTMSSTLSSTPHMAVSSETITVSSATQNGYTLYLSTDNDLESALYRNGDPCGGYVQPTAGTTDNRTALEVNHWGFAIDTDTTTALKNTAIWANVPHYGSESVIKQKTTATPADDTTKILYGALTDNTIPNGLYSNTIIYTAIANLGNNGSIVQSSAPATQQSTPQPQTTTKPKLMSAPAPQPTTDSTAEQEPSSPTTDSTTATPESDL